MKKPDIACVLPVVEVTRPDFPHNYSPLGSWSTELADRIDGLADMLEVGHPWMDLLKEADSYDERWILAQYAVLRGRRRANALREHAVCLRTESQGG